MGGKNKKMKKRFSQMRRSEVYLDQGDMKRNEKGKRKWFCKAVGRGKVQ